MAAVVLVHALLGWLLLAGHVTMIAGREDAGLTTFDVAPPPLSPPPASPTRRATPREEGLAAPPALEARPAPVVAPPRPLPSPVVAAPVAGDASAARAGAAPVPGPGSGAGGLGSGLGAGTGGSGTGGGGGTAARRIAGAIERRDCPKALRKAGCRGEVATRFTVGSDGRVRDCAVTASSGNPELDTATCRVIVSRFRYTPARDAAGRAVGEQRGWRQSWWLE